MQVSVDCRQWPFDMLTLLCVSVEKISLTQGKKEGKKG